MKITCTAYSRVNKITQPYYVLFKGCFVLQLNNYMYILYMSSFHALEIVGRGSETQLQVSENSKTVKAL